ncbi:MAG: hypothetical protein ACK46Q_00915 [Hyphomonas sp.]
MTRTASKAESAKPSPKAFAAAEPFAAMWPVPSTGLGVPTAVEGIKRMSELQMEVAQFAAERARKNVSTMAALAACRTPADFLDVWRRAAVEAVSDYAEETASLLELPKK